MRFITVTTVLAACLAGIPATAQADLVTQWAATLDSADPVEVARAGAALRALAAGELSDPQTHEANFALAEYQVARDDLADSPAAMQEISAAASLYPDDPRSSALLEILAKAQLAGGDDFGAHLSYSQLLKSDPAVLGAATLANAAENAARVGDFSQALGWCEGIDPATVDGSTSKTFHRARLIAGERLGRVEPALESMRKLDEDDPETLRYDSAGQRAAAYTLAAVGLLDEAIERFELLVNLHPELEDHDDALYTLSNLLVRVGRQTRAPRYLDWLLEKHPDSALARTARLEKLDLEADPADGPPIDRYLDLVRASEDLAEARGACQRLVDQSIAEGLALELMTALFSVADEGEEFDRPLSALVARDAANRALEPALELLASREDDVAVAAVSVQAARMELPIPASQRTAVQTARRRLGLAAGGGTNLGRAIDEARGVMDQERWPEAIEQLELAVRFSHKPDPREAAHAAVLLAESLWHDGRGDDALAWIARAAELTPDGADRRFHVLHADILFSAGKTEDACSAYTRAASMGESRWVALQLNRCPTADDAATSGAGS